MNIKVSLVWFTLHVVAACCCLFLALWGWLRVIESDTYAALSTTTTTTTPKRKKEQQQRGKYVGNFIDVFNELAIRRAQNNKNKEKSNENIKYTCCWISLVFGALFLIFGLTMKKHFSKNLYVCARFRFCSSYFLPIYHLNFKCDVFIMHINYPHAT